MEKYHIYYSKYNIIARDYVNYVKIVECEDIYHEIGKMICFSLESIKDIRYTSSKCSEKEFKNILKSCGYRKLSEEFWVRDEIKK